MSHVNVRFRPHVEEMEPKIVPAVTTTWRALVQQAKLLDQHYRAEAAYVASFNDPYCTGHMPGACAWPDPGQLRSELEDLRDSIVGYGQQAQGSLRQWDVELRRLDRQVKSGRQVPVEEILHAKLEVAYYQSITDDVSTYRDEMTYVLSHNDSQLQASTESLWFLNSDNIKGYLTTAKAQHKQVNDYIDARLSERSVYSAEKALARLEGKQDIANYFVDQFLHLVE